MPFARLSLSAVAAAGLSMAFASTPAQAQYADDPPYGYDQPAPGYYPPPAPAYAPPPAYYNESPTVGDVIVVAPRHRMERDPATGAPIDHVYASRAVRYDDLDLTSDWGVRTLHARVVRAAETACNYLDRRYDTLDSGDRSCVDDAVRDAMRQAPIGDSVDASYEGP